MDYTEKDEKIPQEGRFGLQIAVGGKPIDEPVAGQDERDDVARRVRGVGVRDDRRRHVRRLAVEVEPARRLDLEHLLARRKLEGQRRLDEPPLVVAGGEDVDPHRAVGDLLAGLAHPLLLAVIASYLPVHIDDAVVVQAD